MSLTKLLLQVMLVLTEPQVCVPKLFWILLALEARHLIQEHDKFLKVSSFPLRVNFACPINFSKPT